MTKTTAGLGDTPLGILASFLVYAIPLPGPHAVPLLGSSIVAGPTSPARDRNVRGYDAPHPESRAHRER